MEYIDSDLFRCIGSEIVSCLGGDIEQLRVDVGSSSDSSFHSCLDPGVREAGVFTSKVQPAFTVKELLRVLQVLVGCEESEGAQAVGIQAPLLHHHPCAEMSDVLAVDRS